MIEYSVIEKISEKYENRRENLMLILRELEEASGNSSISRETLTLLARLMKLPESAIESFITFYSMFSIEERGKYVIRVCRSAPCHIMGGVQVIDELQRILGIRPGENTSDGLFRLETAECLGLCSSAPAMMINYEPFVDLTPEKLERIISRIRTGEPLHDISVDETENASAIIDNNGENARLTVNIANRSIRKIEAYTGSGGYSAAEKCVRDLSRDKVIDIVKDSGLRGRGGAGFPAGLKWSFVTKDDAEKYVICNADEGEPGTFKDRILMEGNPHALIEGMIICGYAIGAAAGYIYIRGEYRNSIDILNSAIGEARAEGILGSGIFGTSFSFDIFIKEGGGAYVCGEETSLINSMEGKRGYPRFKPPFPGAAGFMGHPTNVNNVETFSSIPLIIRNGAEWYRSAGNEKCSGTKLYALSGRLNRTGLAELPMGVTLRELIEVHGGGMMNGEKFKFAQVGGAAGGIIAEDLLNLPLDYDSAADAGVTLGSGAVTVADEKTCAVDYLLRILSFFEHESCGQCTPCRVGTVHLHHLAKKFAERRASVSDLYLMIEKSELMKKSSLCALGQSPAMPVKTMLNHFRNEFILHTDPGHTCDACDSSLERYYNSGTEIREEIKPGPKFLKLAIEREIEAYAFYVELAAFTDDSQVRDTLLWIANEEKKHRDFLIGYRDGKIPAARTDLSAPEDLKIAEHVTAPEASPEMNSSDAYLIAAHRELESYRFYLKLAALQSDPAVKEMILAIGDEELKHKEKVEYLYTNALYNQTEGG